MSKIKEKPIFKLKDIMEEDITNYKFGYPASIFDINRIPEHTMPNQVKDEIPTMNKFGFMKFEFEEYNKSFINYASNISKPALEIGSAYGWLAKKALEKDINYIASDVSTDHLEILLKNAPKDKLNNLSIYPSEFPKEINFPQKSIGAVFVGRVLHFLTGELIEKGLEKIHNWLDDDGKLFCTNCSIYHYTVKNEIISSYNKKFAEGVKWPGILHNLKEAAPMNADYVDNFLNVFDIPQLEALLPNFGFKIEKISLFDFPNDTDSGGKGHIGFIARKI
ncbi:MAG: class I SAM-dependent methyltransferase [Rickettsiaceae bacterium]|nr:class I SAM-dependent methyltransferase [Rickettsiaceae bacterium]